MGLPESEQILKM